MAKSDESIQHCGHHDHNGLWVNVEKRIWYCPTCLETFRIPEKENFDDMISTKITELLAQQDEQLTDHVKQVFLFLRITPEQFLYEYVLEVEPSRFESTEFDRQQMMDDYRFRFVLEYRIRRRRWDEILALQAVGGIPADVIDRFGTLVVGSDTDPIRWE